MSFDEWCGEILSVARSDLNDSPGLRDESITDPRAPEHRSGVPFDTFPVVIMAHQSDLMLPTLRRYGGACYDFLSKHRFI